MKRSNASFMYIVQTAYICPLPCHSTNCLVFCFLPYYYVTEVGFTSTLPSTIDTTMDTISTIQDSTPWGIPTTMPDTFITVEETFPPTIDYEQNASTSFPPTTMRTHVTSPPLDYTTLRTYDPQSDRNGTRTTTEQDITVTIPLTSTLSPYDETTEYVDATSTAPGGPTKQSKKGEERRCQGDDECEDTEACLTGRCGDPCRSDSCAHRAAVCAVRNHTTHCTCPTTEAGPDLSAECRRGTNG